MPSQTGDILLDKYRIEHVLGGGSFGHVYRAVDLRLGRWVAIKELRQELADDPEMLRRFQNEAVSIAQLKNPHIVMLYDWSSRNNRYYMILEYMDGGSLAALIQKRGTLSPSEAGIIAQAVCNGLAAVHQLGIYHRDIKPANIMLSQDGQTVKISDFGIAHVPASVTGAGALTRTGVTMGTPWYMSPEQARGEPIDHRADLYAVGAMLYEMVAGYTYLDFKNDLFHDIEKIEKAPPRPIPPTVPPELQTIILRALDKNPAARYQSAEEMARALQQCIGTGTTISIPRTPLSLPVEYLPEEKKKIPIWIPIGIAIVIIGILAFALSMTLPNGLTIQTIALSTATLVPTEVPTKTPVPSATPLPTQTEDIAKAVAALFQATQSANATMEAGIARTMTASAPTLTRTVTPSLTPTKTFTPIPTATPIPTSTRVPALRLVGVRFEPSPPYTGDSVVFVITFDNTLPVQQLRWRVHIIEGDVDQINWDKLFYRTDPQVTNIQPGVTDLRTTPPWRIAASAGTRKFFFRIVEVDEGGRVLRTFKSESGQEDWVLTLTPRP